jgi:hypothetical protein
MHFSRSSVLIRTVMGFPYYGSSFLRAGFRFKCCGAGPWGRRLTMLRARARCEL